MHGMVYRRRQQWIHAVCVKEGGCELNPLHDMWLLRAQAMFGSMRKFGESGTGFCVQNVQKWRKAADEFCFEDVKLECFGEFAYLGDMLNVTGGVEQAVAARVRAAWMKFTELGGILCTQRAFLRMKVLCIRHVFAVY